MSSTHDIPAHTPEMAVGSIEDKKPRKLRNYECFDTWETKNNITYRSRKNRSYDQVGSLCIINSHSPETFMDPPPEGSYCDHCLLGACFSHDQCKWEKK